jgi:hypothetical protein
MKRAFPLNCTIHILILAALFGAQSVFSQVGIGTTNPNPNALLDIDATTIPGGLLLPRIALTNSTSPAPLSAHVPGMVVYNTATVADVVPGFYFNDGGNWVRVDAAIPPSNDWTTGGNAGTAPGTGLGQNYIGTSDSQHFILATSGTERMRLLGDGRVSVNGAPLVAADRFTAIGGTDEYALNGYATGNSGVGVYGENATANGIGVFGNVAVGIGALGASTGNGRGVQGVNTGNGFGIIGFSENTGIGVQGQNSDTGTGVLGIVNNGTAVGVTAVNLNTSGVGLTAAANGSTVSLAGTGGTLYGAIGAAGFSNSVSGTGLVGVGNNGTSAYNFSNGSGVSGTGSTTGIYGIATNSSGNRQGGYFTMNRAGGVIPQAANDPVAILAGFNGTDYFGGYFDGNQDNASPGFDYAYVGINSSGTSYKIIGDGTVSTLIRDSDNNNRILFAPEAPEILFEDYGVGQLVNGRARVTIDPLLSTAIHVSKEHPMKVFIQLEGDCKGVFVTDKSAEGFTVKELDNGNSTVPFSWHIAANRADTKTRSGNIVSKHVGVRLPIGPKKIMPNEISELKVQNSKNYTHIFDTPTIPSQKNSTNN